MRMEEEISGTIQETSMVMWIMFTSSVRFQWADLTSSFKKSVQTIINISSCVKCSHLYPPEGTLKPDYA